MNSDGSDKDTILDTRAHEDEAEFSPNGRSVVFTRGHDHLFRMRAIGRRGDS